MKQRGVNLVELMISLAISSMVMAGICSTYLTIKKQTLQQDATNTIFENALIYQQLMAQHIKMAGNTGCQNIAQSTPTWFENAGMQFNFNLKSGQQINVYSFDAAQNVKALPNKVKKRMHPNSDILWLNHIKQGNNLTHINLDKHTITVAGRLEANQGEVLVLSDCNRTYYISAANNASYNTSSQQTTIRVNSLDTLPFAGVVENYTVAKLQSLIFFVGDTSRKTPHGQPVLALYQADMNDQIVELVEGVESVHYHYNKANKTVTTSARFHALSAAPLGGENNLCKNYKYIWKVRA